MINDRKQNRLPFYDYSQNGAYFVTICTKDRSYILGEVVRGGVLDAPQMILSEYGAIVDETIKEINNTYTHLQIDKYAIMPNHIHMIVIICTDDRGTSGTPSLTNGSKSHANAKIPMLVSTLKRFTNKKCGISLWHRSFHDHIIRDESDYQRIWQYIDTNPEKWECDCYYSL